MRQSNFVANLDGESGWLTQEMNNMGKGVRRDLKQNVLRGLQHPRPEGPTLELTLSSLFQTTST